MAYSRTQTKHAPISRHPAFVPLCSVWLAALLSGCIAALPSGMVAASVSQSPFPIPSIAASQAVLAAIAGAAGGLSGWLAARFVVAAQAGGPAKANVPNYPAAEEADAAPPPIRVEILESAETDPVAQVANDCEVVPEPQPEAPLTQPYSEAALPETSLSPGTERHTDSLEQSTVHNAPEIEESTCLPNLIDPATQEAPRHGKAVNLLRTQATGELAMPQLIERFAVALDDHRRVNDDTTHSYSPPTPPADLTEQLRVLVSQLRPTN